MIKPKIEVYAHFNDVDYQDDHTRVNIIIFDEQGLSHFIYSNGDEADSYGNWSREDMTDSGFELIGVL